MGGWPSSTALAATFEVTRATFEVRPYQAPAASGSGSRARLDLMSCVAWLSWPAVRVDPAGPASEVVKSLQLALTWAVLTVPASPAMVWWKAWDRTCRLSAGPDMAVNTQPQTSRASASVLPTATPARRPSPATGLMVCSPRASCCLGGAQFGGGVRAPGDGHGGGQHRQHCDGQGQRQGLRPAELDDYRRHRLGRG